LTLVFCGIILAKYLIQILWLVCIFFKETLMKIPTTSDDSLFLCSARARLLKKEEERRKINTSKGSGGLDAARSNGSFPPPAATPPLGTGPEGCQASALLVMSSQPARSNLAQAITGIEVQLSQGRGSNMKAFITIQLQNQQQEGISKRLTSHLTERARDFTRERCHKVCDVSREYLDQQRQANSEDLFMIGHCHPRREKLKIPGLAAVLHWAAGSQKYTFRLFYFEQVYDIDLSNDTLTENQQRLNYLLQGKWGTVIKCATARFNATDPLGDLPNY
jgi:hypothetical protein